MRRVLRLHIYLHKFYILINLLTLVDIVPSPYMSHVIKKHLFLFIVHKNMTRFVDKLPIKQEYHKLLKKLNVYSRIHLEAIRHFQRIVFYCWLVFLARSPLPVLVSLVVLHREAMQQHKSKSSKSCHVRQH